ncbi:MAG: hypothetical protein K0R15_1057 [Clostridiales bacterium]|jgi:Zn-dependent protease with chaperone function|nr:hypothetical protein [Clostridiales bacterium]
MRIIDTYQAILDIFSNNTFSLDIWDKYADSISSTFKEKVKDDASNYDFNLEILPIISQLLQNRDKFEQAHKAFINVTKELPKRVIDVLNTDLDVSIIFYLGLCNGAGWATSLDGKMVVLLGIEKIVELNWYDERNMIALIYHELGHIWHKHVRTTPTTIATQKENAL